MAEIEFDCLVTVHAIRSKVLMPSPFGRVIEDCRRIVREGKIISFFISNDMLI